MLNNELISRDALIDAIYERPESEGNARVAQLLEAIMKAPAVDAEPVRHGRWAHLGGDEWCCTSCGEVIHTEGSWEKPTRNYCHNCGAKMDLED